MLGTHRFTWTRLGTSINYSAFSVNDIYLISQSFYEKDNSVYEHATEMRERLYYNIEHVLSLGIHRETLLKFLAFSRTTLYLIVQIFPERNTSV